jgi:hypothetical protein
MVSKTISATVVNLQRWCGPKSCNPLIVRNKNLSKLLFLRDKLLDLKTADGVSRS